MKKVLSLLLSIVLLLCAIPAVPAFAADEEIPEGYIGVYDIEDLYCIRYDLDKNYILMNDIDMTEDTTEGGDWDNGFGWAPIGENETLPFTGSFDGRGHTLTGMQIRGIKTNYAGLFGYIKGTIKNLNIDNISLNVSNAKYVGGLVGYSENSSIQNVRVNGTIKNDGELYDCFTGGLIGFGNADTKIVNCANKAEVYSRTLYINKTYGNQYYDLGYSYAGGIIGYGNSVQIQYCFNSGTVTSLSKIYKEYISRRSSSYAGGISGFLDISNIDYCYNTGTITANDAHNVYANGISYGGKVNECINLGFINGNMKSAISKGSISNCYYLKDTAPSGKYNTADTATTAVALSATQMTLKSVFGYLDFDNTWFIDLESGVEHPQLISNPEIEHVHKFVPVVTQPKCTEKGYTTYTCECGESYISDYVDETGHNFGIWTIKDAPTCQKEGTIIRYCSECEGFEEVPVNMVEHKYIDIVTEPTCTKDGYTTHKCIYCGDEYCDTFAKAKGHTMRVKTITPTCTQNGCDIHICSECGYNYFDNEVQATGHAPKRINASSPTASKDGYSGDVICETCEVLLEKGKVIHSHKVNSVMVNDVSINYKSSTTIKPEINADIGAEYTVTYSSSNASVASVDGNGNVYGAKRGNTTITCTVTDSYGNTVSDTCNVNVDYNWWQWIIKIVLFGWLWY